jgi:lipopolysaccharide/colanic/teichoic acid biosynthesis glycosyltransferase
MRIPSPSSHGFFRFRFSFFDSFWAALAPVLALYIPGAYILTPSNGGLGLAIFYCVTSFACMQIASMVFRLNNGISRYFSVHDALNILKAVFTAVFASSLIVFTFTRLEGIPRATPIIYFLIMAGGLIAARAFVMLRDTDDIRGSVANDDAKEHTIVIGATRLSSLYIKFARTYSFARHHVIAVLDDQMAYVGRSIVGVPVVGPIQNLEQVIEEFSEHGVKTDRIVVGGDEMSLSRDSLDEIRRISDLQQIKLQYLPNLVGQEQPPADPQTVSAPSTRWVPATQLPRYHKVKRVIDFLVAAVAILFLSPLFALIALMVLLDVGSPVLFWQQRIGRGGSAFLLYKFRTLRPPFDRHGRPLPDNKRVSWVGKLLRKTRLDELPQLFNVLVGDMSLIGPRPLLSRDQPTNSPLRLQVRPGISGWAQVNGGNLITNDEKGLLDDWYIRNTSPGIDVRIIVRTVQFLLRGERRSEEALELARQQRSTHSWKSTPRSSKMVREEVMAGRRQRRGFRFRPAMTQRQADFDNVQSDRRQDP